MCSRISRVFFFWILCPIAAFSQASAPNGWNDPFPPHKVMDNLYFVGTKELASFLLTTPDGHILMNSNYESSVPLIRANVEKLQFKFTDIKILIAGHAHPDHVEGDAMVKSMTNAQVVVGRLDEAATRNFKPGGKEHPIDRLVDDGDKVTLGGTTLTAHVMPGHTRGCLAWTLDLKENGKTYHALVECSLNGQFLQSLDQYPGIVDDFRATYKKARTLPAEVWVSSHGSFYNLAEKFAKLEKRGANDPNPFVDPQGYLAHVDQFEKSFETALANPGQRGQRGPAQGRGQGQR
jgi:metallo-beta-lactamase class B